MCIFVQFCTICTSISQGKFVGAGVASFCYRGAGVGAAYFDATLVPTHFCFISRKVRGRTTNSAVQSNTLSIDQP
jgi:hypothetical protein